MWDRKSAHYDLLIPEGDNFVENRSRQLQHIYSRCSLQVQSPSRFTSHTNKPSFLDPLKESSNTEQHYEDYGVEEVTYGSSYLEELYNQEKTGDWDWDQDCFIYDKNP